ncbi:MAG: flagellar export chaperone FliS [Oligoflexia bacterium]|nr:flagellar export chaperone FliS [Oligoflexia bacterium]
MKNPYQNYKQTQVGTASREKILLMLYEGAIKYCKLGRKALENRDIAEKGRMIGKTLDIIFELRNTLDFEVGGQVAAQLEQLYNYMVDELSEANLTNDARHFDIVIEMLETLYDGWKQAVVSFMKDKNNKQNP